MMRKGTFATEFAIKLCEKFGIPYSNGRGYATMDEKSLEHMAPPFCPHPLEDRESKLLVDTYKPIDNKEKHND